MESHKTYETRQERIRRRREYVICRVCGERIYKGDDLYEQDDCYEIDGELICGECIQDYIREHCYQKLEVVGC